MKLRWTILVTCALVLMGCDKLADEESTGPALATMRGTLTLAEGMDPPKGDLRLSILWKGEQNLDKSDAGATCGPGDVTSYRDETPLFEQNLELDTDFPAAFSASLSEPPPPGALMSLDGPIATEVKIALGDLIVYRDVNGNGRLDQRGFDEAESPDQVLGSGMGTKAQDYGQSTWYSIAYLTGDLHSTPNLSIAGPTHAGYSLITYAEDMLEAEDRLQKDTPLDGKVQIELTLDATKYLQRWTCRDTCQVEDVCPDDPAELPPVMELGKQTQTDGSWYLEQNEGDKTISVSAACLRGRAGDAEPNAPAREIYRVRITTEENCTTMHSLCSYERGKLPEGVDIPCKEFLEPVAFPNGT